MGGKDYCYAHLLVKMATVGRPPCTYFNNVTSFCLRKIYDGRDPARALCEFHKKRGHWYDRL